MENQQWHPSLTSMRHLDFSDNGTKFGATGFFPTWEILHKLLHGIRLSLKLQNIRGIRMCNPVVFGRNDKIQRFIPLPRRFHHDP